MNENKTLSHQLSQPIITVKVNHPKLVNFPIKMPSHSLFIDVLHLINDSTMLNMFSNYYLTFQGNIVPHHKHLRELASENGQVQLDIVFQHYNYATALHHFQTVNKLIRQPHKFAILLKNQQKNTQIDQVEPQAIGKELIPSSFKMSKSSIGQIISPRYKHQFWSQKRQDPLLLQFLGMSGFNPPTEAQLSGDHFYIHAKTLQGQDLHITASPLGFYLNQSKVNNYNPSPIPGKPVYTSLLDLFCSSSEQFSITYSHLIELSDQRLLDQLADKESSIILSQPDKSQWLDIVEHQMQWNMRKQPTLRDFDKITSSCNDWNQIFLEIERRAQTYKGKVDREGNIWFHNALRRAYKLFEEAAVAGAKKIAQGKIQAMNHADEKRKHIYVYNRIFFSITQETPYNHSLNKGEQIVPTGSSSNTDLIQLSELIIKRPEKLHLLHTVLVFYRGYRMIGQTILPGLLSSQLSNLTQYGSVDENKSINNNPQFHKLLIPLCKQMNLDDRIQALDKDQNLVEIAISPQIKGINSSNGEKYLCDLQRFVPRDLNYIGQEHQGCVLRQELIKDFAKHNKIQEDLPLNPNIGTSIRFKHSQKTEKQEKKLKQMSSYLLTQALTKLANTLKSKTGGDYLTDSQGLSNVFHSHGVNMRYLGQLHDHQLLKDAIDVKICLSRGILVRSLKHVFRQALKNLNSTHLSTTIAHLLNCIFARKSHINILCQSPQPQDRQVSPQPKRKKKKKQKQQESKHIYPQTKIIKIEQSHYYNIKPDDLWKEIRQIAQSRYKYVFEPKIIQFHTQGLFRLQYQKYATLRDLCLCVGLKLQRKNYLLRQCDPDEGLPFSSKNIAGFNIKTKVPTTLCLPQICQLIKSADRLFSESQFQESLKIYEKACKLMRESSQGSQLSHCLGQISRIHYMLGSIKEACGIEASNLAYLLKTQREDSFQTIRCYSRLGLYCMNLGIADSALWLLGRGLNLMLMCFGEAYPDVLINFANIARVYLLNHETSLASNCYFQALQLLKKVHGHNSHINASFCYSSLASIYYQAGDYKKSVEYQNETVCILMKALPPQDPRNLDAQKILKVYNEIKKTQPKGFVQNRKK